MDIHYRGRIQWNRLLAGVKLGLLRTRKPDYCSQRIALNLEDMYSRGVICVDCVTLDHRDNMHIQECVHDHLDKNQLYDRSRAVSS